MCFLMWATAKVADVVDWVFGFMRAVRDACPYNVIATIFVENRKYVIVYPRKCVFFGGTWCVFE